MAPTGCPPRMAKIGPAAKIVGPSSSPAGDRRSAFEDGGGEIAGIQHRRHPGVQIALQISLRVGELGPHHGGAELAPVWPCTSIKPGIRIRPVPSMTFSPSAGSKPRATIASMRPL